ncbi:MAG: sulfotransferase family 2 domain-containing protein [Gammaproteobacteria bacterium]
MPYKQFFWLHVKKSAGITTRALLQPYYVEVDREDKPKNFIQATPEEYNDILNNYRVVLGEYQFKRCLFAKKYLYPGQWDDIFSFAFSREPVDRCVSMFSYLYWKDRGYIKNLEQSLKRSMDERKFVFNTSYAFDVFLNHARQARLGGSIYRPLGIHFTTHTAPMWDDITDDDGHILLKAVFRLESLHEGLNRVFDTCGINKKLAPTQTMLNKNERRRIYSPTYAQIGKIEEIYGRDFEVYENALH